MFITVSGIQIELERKFIKNMHLCVLPPDGRVRVSAPMFLPEYKIINFITEKLAWIQKKRAKFDSTQTMVLRSYVTGETLFVWGKPFALSVEPSSRNIPPVVFEETVRLFVRPESSVAQKQKLVREWYRSILKERIEDRLPYWEQVMNLYCSSWQTKYMTSRWGSCNIKTKKIWLNVQLASKKPECLDYVIVHELAHLKERHHDKRFYSIVSEFYPDWKNVKKMLNTL